MRLNEPTANHEVEMMCCQLLALQTAVGRHIEFVDEALVDIGGRSEGELRGAPHNDLRHLHKGRSGPNIHTTRG